MCLQGVVFDKADGEGDDGAGGVAHSDVIPASGENG